MTQSTAMERSQSAEPLSLVRPNENNSITKLNMRELKDLAGVLMESGSFPDIKSAAQAMVKVIAGQELGFSPIVSMTGIHFFQGKVEFSATLKASLIKASGKYNYKILQHTNEVCEIAFFEKVGNEWISSGVPCVYTMADARIAKLADKDNYKKHPKDMLFAGCIRQGQRRYCADVLHGLGSESDEPETEEVDARAIEDAKAENMTIDGEIIDTATGEVIKPKQQSQPAPGMNHPDNAASTSTTDATDDRNNSVKTAVDLAYKLQKDYAVEAEDLAMQFLPEGVGKFSDLTEEQAAEAVPGLSALLTTKIAARKG